MLTQCLVLTFSELQVRVDGVGETSSHRDAVDVAVRESTGLARGPLQCRDCIVPTQALAKHVNELVGRINGVYGTLEYSPIHYINQSIPQDELIAIYHLADACLVTSVRDGMNLVSHEYVAAQELSLIHI